MLLACQRVSPGVLAVVCLVVGACGESGGPSSPPDPLRLAVAALVDSATFRSQGEFLLDLVPSDRSGQTFLDDQWDIGLSLLTPSSVAASKVSEGVEPADTNPVATAILIDDSGSMRYSDPDRNRASAAQLYWSAVLPARTGNVAALLDFGRGTAPTYPGFEQTTLLAGFSSNTGELDAALDNIQAIPGGATPLYGSATEVMSWIDSSVPADFKRVLVVITDGKPSDQAAADSLFATARDLRIRIFSVGVGEAAEQNPASPAAILVEELATKTGGIYATAEPATELQEVLAKLAVSASPERLLVRVRLDPIPPLGAAVSGTTSITAARGTANADWSFAAP